MGRKMQKATIINISIIVMTVFIMFAASITGNAAGHFKSQGKIVFTNKTTSGQDDVVFDSEDFERLAAVCK